MDQRRRVGWGEGTDSCKGKTVGEREEKKQTKGVRHKGKAEWGSVARGRGIWLGI